MADEAVNLPYPTDHIHKDAFYRGIRDFKNGKLDNPYRKNTLFAKEWERGFNKAYFSNLALIQKGIWPRVKKPHKVVA